MIFQHVLTQQLLQVKRAFAGVFTLYLLDDDLNKIEDGLNADGSVYYKIVVCSKSNLVETIY